MAGYAPAAPPIIFERRPSMNELKVFNFNQVDVVDSREVAKLVEKQHKNLLRDIDSYIETMRNSTELKIEPSDFFITSTYKDSTGRTLPCYLLTKKGCDMVANKMTGEKGVLFTAAYVTAFEKMREQTAYALPKDYPSALRALADAEEKRLALVAENETQRQIIADFQPIKQYVDTILASTGTMTITQIAADYDMSARKLNRILHEAGIQRCVNGQWILYKQHMGKGYTKSVTFNFQHTDGRPDAKPNTQWTQKGRLLINRILNDRGILAVMDRKAA